LIPDDEEKNINIGFDDSVFGVYYRIANFISPLPDDAAEISFSVRDVQK
jgi:hypothetical protein